MARCRIISPEFFKDEELCELPIGTRLLFAGLWTLADREGRLEYRPKRIKSDIFPYENINVDECLKQLDGKFIEIYEVEGRKYLQINNFLKYQKPHPRETESSIPPNTNQGSPKVDQRQTFSTPRLPVSISVSVSKSEYGEGDGNGSSRANEIFTKADVDRILKAYPNRQGLRAAEWQVGRVLVTLRERGVDDAVKFLLDVITAYSESDVVKRGKMYSARRFFEDGHYDDDPSTWSDSKPKETKTTDDEIVDPTPEHLALLREEWAKPEGDLERMKREHQEKLRAEANAK